MNQPRADFGFYATIPRMVRTGYKHLTAVQKWLYACLKDLCGDTGTCYRSLRVLSEETGISTGMLSESIRLLHDAELIHAEKKKRPAGGKEVWHITIADIWIANGKLHPSKRSQSEQTIQPSPENVHSVNKNVRQVNDKGRERSVREQERSLCETEERTSRQEHSEAKTVEERTLVPSPTQPSSSLLEWIKQEKIPCPKDPVKVQEYIEILAPITSREQLHRYYVSVKARYQSDQSKTDKKVWLGNLADEGQLDAFLDAEKAMQPFTPAAAPTPVETASQSDIEGLAAEIRSVYPELVLRLSEDTYGPYVDVLYGSEELECYTMRDAEDWSAVSSSQKRLARVIEYGQAHCLTTIAG